jgi:hypothetical protein
MRTFSCAPSDFWTEFGTLFLWAEVFDEGMTKLDTPLKKDVQEMDDNVERTMVASEEQTALIPIEQETILFHGEEIIAVRLEDNRICVILRWICESIKLQPGSQVRKIQRTTTTAGELVRVVVQTKGGPQTMPAITLRGFPVWMLTINPNETQDEHMRELIRAYQEEAKDVLYEHFLQKGRQGALPESHAILPAEPIRPTEPTVDVAHDEWITYYHQMIRWHQWQQEMEQWRNNIEAWQGETNEWRGGVESRIESLEEVVRSVLPQPGLTSEHQANVRGMVKRLADLSGTSYQTIYWELTQQFQAPKYSDILDTHYQAVCMWFQQRIEAAKKNQHRKS